MIKIEVALKDLEVLRSEGESLEDLILNAEVWFYSPNGTDFFSVGISKHKNCQHLKNLIFREWFMVTNKVGT